MLQLNLPLLHHLQCIIKVGRKYILNSNQKQIKKRQIQRLNFGGTNTIQIELKLHNFEVKLILKIKHL